jgi:hypothetical protein
MKMVRGFARYLKALDDRNELPPSDLVPNRLQRKLESDTPYDAALQILRYGAIYMLLAAKNGGKENGGGKAIDVFSLDLSRYALNRNRTRASIAPTGIEPVFWP